VAETLLTQHRHCAVSLGQTQVVIDTDRDWLIRLHAFAYLEELTNVWGDILPWRPLSQGFEFDGERITLVGMPGIWKPRAMRLPISIRTGPADPYGDTAGEDGFLRYRYFKTDPMHPDNRGLRSCFEEARPLVYFRGVEKGWYTALWPMLLIGDDPSSLTFTAACDDVALLRPGVSSTTIDHARRQYVTRTALVRLHQARFRQQVLTAYSSACTVCSLRHRELLDAAHILSDRHERGEPIVPNGLAMCKIHHSAFDANILGVRPDRVIEIRADVLEEIDGPMLRHGLQELNGSAIKIPRRPADRPDPERLEERYELFRAAS
jgi:putative restriction endonuclease